MLNKNIVHYIQRKRKTEIFHEKNAQKFLEYIHSNEYHIESLYNRIYVNRENSEIEEWERGTYKFWSNDQIE